MTKFQKLQKISSIIPVFSTVFVAFVTMFKLKRYNATKKIWFYFILCFFLPGFAAWEVNTFLMSGQYPILNVIVVGLILSIANILMVELQVAAAKDQSVPECVCATETKRTSSNKSTVRPAVIAFIAFSVAAPLLIMIVILISIPSNKIEDINGKGNANLAVITIDEIVSGKHRYTAYGHSESVEGEQTGVTGHSKKFDYDYTHIRCKRISGIATLHATKATSDQLVLEIDSEVTAGNLGIVIVVDGEYYQSVAVNEVCTVTLSDVAGKTVLVKMGVESAEIDVTVTRG